MTHPFPGYYRGRTFVRFFSDTEDDLITDLRIAGYGTAAIARIAAGQGHPRRSQATINMRLKTLVAREED